MATSASNFRLFEVNLIGDRIQKSFRRRALQKWCTVGTAVMLLAALVMAIRIVVHLSAGFGVNSRIRADERQIQKDEEGIANLDKLKQDVLARVRNVAPLVAIADAKVDWAPKLVALGEASPSGASLMTFQGSQGDLFGALATTSSTAGSQAPGVKINFAVVYIPDESSEENPINLVKRLRASKDFLRHLDHVGLDSLENETEEGSSVVILRGTAEGARSQ
jgi:hypothetical protein